MENTSAFYKLSLLGPSFFTYWAVLTCLGLFVWFMWTKAYPQFKFKWQGPVLAALGFSLYTVVTTALNLHQGGVLFTEQQAQQAKAQAAQSQAQQGDDKNVDPVIKMKNNFLQTVDAFAAHPEQITDENLKKLDAGFAPLFKDESERNKVYATLRKFYDCQRYFWEDAMASFKSKSNIKSDSRKACEKEDGSFFQREKLLTVEVLKSNDIFISNVAGHKRVPASDGKEVEVTEDILRQNLDANIGFSTAVKKLLTR